MPCLIIGIGGVTCGGKTSLTSQIDKHFKNVHIINADDYYWPEGSPNHEYLEEFQYENWDIPSSIDYDSLINTVQSWKKRHENSDDQHILLLDGFLIYESSGLVPLFDKKYFMTLSEEQCWERRKVRVYEPPEPEGYFQKIAWPCYLEHKERMSSRQDLTYLDANQSLDDMYETVQKDLHLLLATQ